jgi:hypothetical protein
MKRPGEKHRSDNTRRYFNPKAILEQAETLNIRQGYERLLLSEAGLAGRQRPTHTGDPAPGSNVPANSANESATLIAYLGSMPINGSIWTAPAASKARKPGAYTSISIHAFC